MGKFNEPFFNNMHNQGFIDEYCNNHLLHVAYKYQLEPLKALNVTSFAGMAIELTHFNTEDKICLTDTGASIVWFNNQPELKRGLLVALTLNRPLLGISSTLNVGRALNMNIKKNIEGVAFNKNMIDCTDSPQLSHFQFPNGFKALWSVYQPVIAINEDHELASMGEYKIYNETYLKFHTQYNPSNIFYASENRSYIQLCLSENLIHSFIYQCNSTIEPSTSNDLPCIFSHLKIISEDFFNIKDITQQKCNHFNKNKCCDDWLNFIFNNISLQQDKLQDTGAISKLPGRFDKKNGIKNILNKANPGRYDINLEPGNELRENRKIEEFKEQRENNRKEYSHKSNKIKHSKKINNPSKNILLKSLSKKVKPNKNGDSIKSAKPHDNIVDVSSFVNNILKFIYFNYIKKEACFQLQLQGENIKPNSNDKLKYVIQRFIDIKKYDYMMNQLLSRDIKQTKDMLKLAKTKNNTCYKVEELPIKSDKGYSNNIATAKKYVNTFKQENPANLSSFIDLSNKFRASYCYDDFKQRRNLPHNDKYSINDPFAKAKPEISRKRLVK